MGANCLFTVGFGQLLLVVTYLSTIDTKILQENKNLGTGNTGKAIYIPGDIIIGGLFPVHQKGFSGEYTGKGVCGDINIDRGVQRSEAMIFTIKEINKDNSILPGVDLGVKVLDTCARGTYALEQSLEFIRASFTTLDASDFRCEDGSFARLNTTHETVAGVIGGAYSEVSKQVANLLRLFKLPQISYASTSAALSDKNRYEYFARTVPPDNFQAKAMVDIVLKFNWTYVSTVASEGNYGQSGIEEFKVKAGEKNICIAEEIKILSNSNPSTFDIAIEKLIKKENANIVVLFLRVEDAKNLLAAATRQNLRDRFVWIAADGWGAQEIPVENNEEAAKGALTIDLQSTTLTKFDDYFMSLTPDKNSINPWFTEYWESVHGCKFVDSYLGDSDNSNITLCTGREKISRKNFKQESKVQFVYDAVQAMARAIDRMQRDICPDRVGPVP
ncbi:hypothetical protein FSP39_016399 [Pinctada imbricata]|uniref:Receptor ligand binding region domain-containing protein n=1 Tax=Pinctada imbricata TaxID=66713 RepID=A0AA89C6Q2_PINIB|nr:hypothetical protein FSP39_016399 [Pinctada imbricata]